jgi:Virulence-associated protein E
MLQPNSKCEIADSLVNAPVDTRVADWVWNNFARRMWLGRYGWKGAHPRYDGDTGWAFEAFNHGALNAALAARPREGIAVGLGFIKPGESTTYLAAFDLDDHDKDMDWSDMQAAALALLGAARKRGLYGFPDRSVGGSGIHVWFRWADAQDAASVRTVLDEVLADCGYENGDGGVRKKQIEAFPKQDAVRGGGCGNWLALPCQWNSRPLDDTFDELDDMPVEAVLDIDWRMSEPVPAIERTAQTERTVARVAVPVELEKIQAALDAIQNDGGEDSPPYKDGPKGSYLSVVWGVGDGTGYSDVGREMLREWTSKNPKHEDDAEDDKQWAHGLEHKDREDRVTVDTLFWMAREHDPDGFGKCYPQFPVASPDDFPLVESTEPVLPSFDRNKAGGILPTEENTSKALAVPSVTGWHIAYDSFKDEMVMAPAGTDEWRAVKDADVSELRLTLCRRGFTKAPKELVRDYMDYVAQRNEFDTAKLWLNGLPEWDGVPRVERFLADYLGADATDYTRAVSRYLWTALAGRVLDPGCEAPMVPVLIGAQGAGKSRAVKAISPAPEFFCELDLADRDEKASRLMRGRLVVELGELRGLHSRDSQSIKAFISRTHENWTPKFKEFATTFARRFLFIGTTNEDEFLADDTGERRWLPVRVGQCDVDAIARDRLQLWAEAREKYGVGGIEWQDAERLARDVHAEHKISDPWHPIVAAWLDQPDGFAGADGTPRARGFLSTHEILTGALGMAATNINRAAEKRLATVMTALGYRNERRRVSGEKMRGWAACR